MFSTFQLLQEQNIVFPNQRCQIAVYTAIFLKSSGKFLQNAVKFWEYSGKIAEFCLTDIWRWKHLAQKFLSKLNEGVETSKLSKDTNKYLLRLSL
jgi:hypothetical protein